MIAMVLHEMDNASVSRRNSAEILSAVRKRATIRMLKYSLYICNPTQELKNSGSFGTEAMPQST